jgi:hypothetical protein
MSGKNSKTAAERKARDDWRTPRWLWDRLNEQYNFTTDCAANETNHLTDHWFGEDGTEHGEVHILTPKVAWCNPPFSNAKMLAEHWVRYIRRVGIYRADNMETAVWQEIILPNVDWVFLPKGRINYAGHEGKGAMFPSCIFGSGVPAPEDLQGIVLWRWS